MKLKFHFHHIHHRYNYENKKLPTGTPIAYAYMKKAVIALPFFRQDKAYWMATEYSQIRKKL